MRNTKKQAGSGFDDFLCEEGIREEAQEQCGLTELALKLEAQRKKLNLSKAELAKRMGTSRSAVDRILDPSYAGLTMDSLRRAATALHCRIEFSLLPAPENRRVKALARRPRAIA